MDEMPPLRIYIMKLEAVAEEAARLLNVGDGEIGDATKLYNLLAELNYIAET